MNISNCSFFDAVFRKNKPCCIKIVSEISKPRKLYVYSDNLLSIDELKTELEDCNAMFEGQAVRKNGFLRQFLMNIFAKKDSIRALEKKDVESWSVVDVESYLRLLGYKSKDIKRIRDAEIDGNILAEVDFQTLRNLELEEEVADRLSSEINRLTKSKKFTLGAHNVRMKMEKFPDFNAESEDVQKMIGNLSDVAKLKHRFLSTTDLITHTTNEMGQMEEAHTQKFDINKVNIKLVVTEVGQVSKMVALQKAISPVVSAFIPKLAPDFGFFHTAVIVGPWYLEWTESELIIPKRMVCGKAVISADVDSLTFKRDNLHVLTDKLAEIVVKYNTIYKFKFSDMSRNKGDCKNSQDFVDDIFKALELENVFDGALGEFISRMRATGKANLTFAPCEGFRNFFNISEKEFMFQSHRELDEFCVACREQCLDIDQTFSSEWALLKSFDRAFWLRHLKCVDIEKYQPLPPKEIISYKPFATGCPFQDPRETMSYV